jgi:hypothetical protein
MVIRSSKQRATLAGGVVAEGPPRRSVVVVVALKGAERHRLCESRGLLRCLSGTRFLS